MVLPCAAMFCMIATIFLALNESRPVVGSSQNRSGGSVSICKSLRSVMTHSIGLIQFFFHKETDQSLQNKSEKENQDENLSNFIKKSMSTKFANHLVSFLMKKNVAGCCKGREIQCFRVSCERNEGLKILVK